MQLIGKNIDELHLLFNSIKIVHPGLFLVPIMIIVVDSINYLSSNSNTYSNTFACRGRFGTGHQDDTNSIVLSPPLIDMSGRLI